MEFYLDDFDLVPYTRMTQKGKYVAGKAHRYLSSKDNLGWRLKRQMSANGWLCLPPKQDLYVMYVIQRKDLYTFDLDNGLKAILDAAKGIVFEDDRYVTVDLGGMKKRGSPCLKVAIGLVKDLDGDIKTCNWRARLLEFAPRYDNIYGEPR